jgi:nucleotide-binding universal stress UspA family protein
MATIRHILFPFDFSAQSCEILPYVRAIAQACQAKVTMFSVVPPTWDLPPDGMRPLVGDGSSDARQALQAHLDRSVEDFPGVTVERVADAGDPALRITAFAHTHGVDLIMMPTHGLGPFRTLLMGSVTSKVLHDAACAVWTAAHTEAQHSPVSPRKVLCAIDTTPETPALLKQVAEFCRQIGASLTVMHAVGPVTDWPSLASERALQDRYLETARERAAALQRAAGVDAPLVVAVGEVVDAVTDEARREAVDLLVIGRGSVSAPFGRLRTHAFGIIERSPCPVLSV